MNFSVEESEDEEDIEEDAAPKVNDKVMLKELNQEVTVLSLPDKNDNLFIQMGMIKTKVKKDKLAVFNKELAKKTTLPNYQKETFTLKKYNVSNTLDLRGKRVEEALDEIIPRLINKINIYILYIIS